jgi:hypothetical protein
VTEAVTETGTGTCPHGHGIEDLAVRPNGTRTCRKCAKARRKKAKKAARAAKPLPLVFASRQATEQARLLMPSIVVENAVARSLKAGQLGHDPAAGEVAAVRIDSGDVESVLDREKERTGSPLADVEIVEWVDGERNPPTDAEIRTWLRG